MVVGLSPTSSLEHSRVELHVSRLHFVHRRILDVKRKAVSWPYASRSSIEANFVSLLGRSVAVILDRPDRVQAFQTSRVTTCNATGNTGPFPRDEVAQNVAVNVRVHAEHLSREIELPGCVVGCSYGVERHSLREQIDGESNILETTTTRCASCRNEGTRHSSRRIPTAACHPEDDHDCTR